ncbi:SDR family NAD(P)-dependent oxidoreductase [Shimia haliotis]|uniref:NAD(P)-dependent dehydrogenase, short-chain alcohol dehydrogenase family n=1 Tax=Shimia haliotis TaxID=1280847 RepID=A0A1I4A169_9RHOB|nr:SDR family NAD(P)-dependent oxidoreductase [Shimia haliotis]SFK49529.1 NAD(P)-dependent dehydrogenase, short-chain alcohol dehydrogenase family [Shimia haliotis]
MSLQGKHALVTGGGTGIGLAIAQALAAEGANVTITGRRLEVLQDAATDNIHPLAMDVADEESMVDGVAAAVAARGPIQICVANAGIAEGRALHKTDMAFWRKMMSINIDGVFLTIRESLKSMNQTDWGRVMVISSIAGLRGLKGAPAYSTSKHAVNGMIKSLAADYALKPITFNSICPAYVETAIIDQNIESIMARTGCSEEEARHMMVGVNPHGRLIKPEEVANTALYLCSDLADSVRGQTLQVAGGEM